MLTRQLYPPPKAGATGLDALYLSGNYPAGSPQQIFLAMQNRILLRNGRAATPTRLGPEFAFKAKQMSDAERLARIKRAYGWTDDIFTPDIEVMLLARQNKLEQLPQRLGTCIVFFEKIE